MSLNKSDSDISVWKSFRKGNKEAFQKIYFDHYRFLYNYCRKFTNDKELVEDILQDLFVTIFIKKERLSNTNNIRLYLFCSARRSLFKALNTKHYKTTDLYDQTNPDFHFDEGVIPDYGEEEEDNRLSKVLHRTVNNLGARQKEIVYMKYFSGLNNKEIADVLGVSYQTVRNTLHNALKKIRKDFDEESPRGKMVVLFQSFKTI